MSAYDDIRAALEAAPIRKPGWERVVFVGISAEQSIRAAMATDHAPQWALQEINHVSVMRVQPSEGFKGWAIRDCDLVGQWHDLQGRASTDPNFERVTVRPV